jgi:membrane protease YdiL (CAAX protease family)
MQNILNISKSWHDHIPSLKRIILLILAILFVEFFVLLLKGQRLPFSQNYLLVFLRAADVFILAIWGPWSFKGLDIWKVVKDALIVTLFFAGAGFVLLMGWKQFYGSSLLKISYEKGFFNNQFIAVAFFTTRCLISPVAEELFFRGIIYRKIREKLNVWICMAVVSSIFALIHFYFSRQLLAGLMPFLGSVVFCLGYEKTKFILTPILLHISGNFIIFFSPFLRFI